MQLILFENTGFGKLYPFSLSRHTSEIRVGINTLRASWEMTLNLNSQLIGRDFLSQDQLAESDEYVYIDPTVLPGAGISSEIRNLKAESGLMLDGNLIAMRSRTLFTNPLSALDSAQIDLHAPLSDFDQINYPEDIFTYCGLAIEIDFKLVTEGKKSAKPEAGTTIIGQGELFIEQGARIMASVINTESGPVYIGKDALVMEGCMIRGPFALGEEAHLKMGAKIYGATSIGPSCKVGGEVNNSVIFAYSNKAHDGFIGNSVIGEWCNLGADTNTSNLKNTYSEVNLYDIASSADRNTGKVFCGLMMGDHSKCGINTMFNTGTVVGFSANIFGAGFPAKYIPSFSWGGSGGLDTFRLDKAIELAKKVMSRRNKEFGNFEQSVFEQEFKHSSKDRF